MPTFKKQIENAFLKNDWEIVLIDSNDEWWLEEFWEIKSNKRGFPASLFISFEKDPMSIDIGKNSSSIWCIRASKNLPKDRLDDKGSISELNLTTRKFKVRLEKFIKDINDFRK